ncbi:MAG: outer membrane lipoprotein carrier protein LolA [Fimbriimonadaceae bacterium]
MMRTLRLAIGVVLLAAGIAVAQGPAEGPRLLQHAIKSRLTLKMRGERVVTLPNGTRIRERIHRNGMRMRIQITEPASLRESVAVEDGNQRRQYVPDRNEIRIMPSREAEFYDRIQGLIRPLRRGFRVEDGGTIAGLPTRMVGVPEPRGDGLAKFWIHADSGAVLKSQVTGPEGETVASFEFLTAEIVTEMDSSLFALNKPGATVVTPLDDLRRLSRELGMVPWHIREEGGWQLMGTRPIGPPRSKSLMQSYANGDMRVSLFHVVGRDIDPKRVGNLVGPGMHVHSFRKGESRLFIIGPLDGSALQRLAQRVTD